MEHARSCDIRVALWWFAFEDDAHCMFTIGDQQQPPEHATWTRAGTFCVPVSAIRILTTDQDHVLDGCCASVKMDGLEYGFTSMKASRSADTKIGFSSLRPSKYPLHKISWNIWDLRMISEPQTDLRTATLSFGSDSTQLS